MTLYRTVQVGERLDKNRTVKATRGLNEDDTLRRFGEGRISHFSPTAEIHSSSVFPDQQVGVRRSETA